MKRGKPQKNFETIIDGKSYWISRSVTTVGVIFGKDKDGKVHVLINKRGIGCPTNVHKWNSPCGYLDYYETLNDAVSREVHEETGVLIDPSNFKLYRINAYDKGDQNVSVVFYTMLDMPIEETTLTDAYSEPNEVEEIKWVYIQDLNNYEFAYNHISLIMNIFGDKISTEALIEK